MGEGHFIFHVQFIIKPHILALQMPNRPNLTTDDPSGWIYRQINKSLAVWKSAGRPFIGLAVIAKNRFGCLGVGLLPRWTNLRMSNMFRRRESNLELLLKAPWWISAALGLISFSALRWGLPAWAGDVNARQMIAKGVSPLAPLPLLFFSLIAFGSFLFAKKRRRLVDEQTSLEKLRETGWKDFEYLVAEVFRRQGYDVDYSLGRGADGGVDLTLRRNGRTALVQCKQRKVFSIGAPVIREMFGLMTAKNADEAIIVITGKFTRDAQEFAAGKPIRLIDGPQLLALVRSVQSRPGVATAAEPKPELDGTPDCPTCGRPMVLRTSRRGANAGNQFWGCSSYPTCKTTRVFETR